MNEASALVRAFEGVDCAFLLIPPANKASNMRGWQNDVGTKLLQAVKAAKVRHVVFLSNVKAEYEEGTGIILGLHDMENG